MLPLSVPKERAAGKERLLAWAVYVVLVAGFLAYAISLVTVALDRRATGDVATSFEVKQEQWALPNIDVCGLTSGDVWTRSGIFRTDYVIKSCAWLGLKEDHSTEYPYASERCIPPAGRQLEFGDDGIGQKINQFSSFFLKPRSQGYEDPWHTEQDGAQQEAEGDLAVSWIPHPEQRAKPWYYGELLLTSGGHRDAGWFAADSGNDEETWEATGPEGFLPQASQVAFDAQDYSQYHGDWCLRIHYEDFKATKGGELTTLLAYNDEDWFFFLKNDLLRYFDYHHAVSAYIEESGGKYQKIHLALNSTNYVTISKHVHRKWDGEEVITYPTTIVPAKITGNPGWLLFNSYDAQYQYPEYSFFAGPADSYESFARLTVTTSSESYELLKEQDPLDLLAILGQLGGVFSFIALGFGAVFVRINPEVEERRAHSVLSRCVNPTSSTTDLDPSDGEHVHAAPSAAVPADTSVDVKI